jgi:isoquinoline 1-oxidoreductase subunit beta
MATFMPTPMVTKPMSRRTFTRALAQASCASSLAWVLGGTSAAHAQSATANGDAFTANRLIRVQPNGAIEFLSAATEMGQGAATGIAMILASEMDADWSRVSIRTVRPDGRRMMFTGGAMSTAVAWNARALAATARDMLLQAGADVMGVPASECFTEKHAVVHRASGRRMDYAQLVAKARTLKAPEKPTLKDHKTLAFIGQSFPATNLDDILQAALQYGVDVRIPGMLYASIERAPTVNGRLASVDDKSARAMPGVAHVLKLRGNTFPSYNYWRDGVAVLANSSWAAMQARKKLVAQWNGAWGDEPGTYGRMSSSAELAQEFTRVLTTTDPKGGEGFGADVLAWRSGTEQSIKAAFDGAAKTLDMTYDLPLQAHAPMEPMNATAHWQGDRCELWVGTHYQWRLFNAIKELTGLANDKITIHTTALGGSFGRRQDVDYAIEAVLLSREVGKPVQLLWTREDDMRCGLYSAPSKHRIRVALDAAGKPAAIDHAFAAISQMQQMYIAALPDSGNDPAASTDAIKFPYIQTNYQVRHRLIQRAVRVYAWRRGYTHQHTFALECALDECAYAAGMDPLAYRLQLLPPAQKLNYNIKWRNAETTETIDSGRLANVLNLAAQAANWGSPLPAGGGRGIAATVTGTHLAMVLEVSVQDKQIRVERAVVAVDCGVVINPQLVKAQVEGGIAFGLTAALKGSITFDNGQVQQSNFTDYPLLRLQDMPQIETILVQSNDAPTGVGEQVSHPVAAALANAVFAATRERLRSLPLQLT